MKERFKYLIGRVLVVLLPIKAKRLRKNGMTIVLTQKLSKVDYLMRAAILKRADKNQDFDDLAELHRNYWVNKGSDLFEYTDIMFDNFFLPDWSFIFDELESQFALEENSFNTLVEIGTGNGNVLNYLSEKFPEINRFVGIDLSVKQIEINKQKFKDHLKLEFVASDALDWVKLNGKSNMIFVTSGGVLEYFTQKNLERFLQYLNSLGKIIFIAIEPIGVTVDFDKDANTQTYGPERSFSHNYPKLFKAAGFTIWHQSKKEYANTEWYFTFIGAAN